MKRKLKLPGIKFQKAIAILMEAFTLGKVSYTHEYKRYSYYLSIQREGGFPRYGSGVDSVWKAHMNHKNGRRYRETFTFWRKSFNGSSSPYALAEDGNIICRFKTLEPKHIKERLYSLLSKGW